MGDNPGTPHICVCNMGPHLDGHTRMPLPSLTIERATAHWAGLTAAERSEMPPNIQRFVSDWVPLPDKETPNEAVAAAATAARIHDLKLSGLASLRSQEPQQGDA